MWITDQTTEVCVDDFALRKGTAYGTVIIDSNSRRVIDMIPSRERQDVAAKLAEYPNLKVVSGDGSPTYAAAIAEADPEILQVSDRSHLLKGLTEACRCIIRGLFQPNIAIEKNDSAAMPEPSGYNSTYWEKSIKKDAPEREHGKAIAKKEERMRQVRSMDGLGLKISGIARQTGLSWATVKKYIQKDYHPEGGGYGQKRPSKLKPYEGRIKEMLCRKCSFKEVEAQLRRGGCTGASSTIRMYATRERRLIRQAAGSSPKADVLERKWLIKLLYKPMDELQGIDGEQVGRLLEEYPVVQDIYAIVEINKLRKEPKPP